MMKGLGFLVWKLRHTVPTAAQVAAWKEIGVQWISIKVRDYTNEYNRRAELNDGSMKLEDLLVACREAGISVGTWQFIYTTNLAEQARLISEDISEFQLDHLMIDAEENGRVYPYAHWKTFPRYKTEEMAKEYLRNLLVPDDFPVGLCSYRYPSYHPEFPWAAFLDHPKVNMVNPQVYWVSSSNPGYQFTKSKTEFAAKTTKPFIPIGSAYEEGGWQPTAGQIQAFNELAKENTPAWGYYRWGQAKYHQDWLQAMRVEVTYPEPVPDPEPEPEPPQVEIPKARLAEGISALRIRSGPSIAYPIIGRITGLPEVEILERRQVTVANPGDTEWFRIGYGQWSAAKYAGVRYLEEVGV